MSAQTIRNVVVQVAMESGANRLASADLSAIRALLATQSNTSAARDTAMAQSIATMAAGFSKLEQQRLNASAQSEKDGRVEAGIGAVKGLVKLATASDQSSDSLNRNVESMQTFAEVAMNAGKALGPVGIGLAVIAGELLLTKKALDEARETSNSYWSEIAQDAQKTHASTVQSAVRQHQHASELATANPDISVTQRSFANVHYRNHREASIRAIEVRDDLNPDQKADFRTRIEKQGGLNEQRVVAFDEYQSKQQRIRQLEAADRELQNERKNIDGSAGNARTTAKDQLKHASEISTFEKYYDASTIGVSRLVNVGIDRESGQFNSQAKVRDEAKANVAQVEVSVTDARLDVENRILANAKEKLKLEEESTASLVKQHSITREMQQAAYTAVRSEKEHIRQGAIEFGTSSVADQSRELRLQAKHERISFQRERNRKAGLPENLGVDRYTHSEMQFGARVNNVASATINAQAIEDAERAGVKKIHNVDTLKEKQDWQAHVDKFAIPETDELKAAIAKASQSTKQMAEDLITHMKAAFNTHDLVEELKRQLGVIEATNKSNGMVRNKTFN